MSEDLQSTFEFKINDWNSDGLARVEYIHRQLGSIVKQVFIPFDLSAEHQRGAVISAFPRVAFHMRWIDMVAKKTGKPAVPAVMAGQFEYNVSHPEDNAIAEFAVFKV